MFGVAVVAIRDMAFTPGRLGLSLPQHERLVVPAQVQTVSASGTPNLARKAEVPNISGRGAGQELDTAEDESETEEQHVEANLDAIEYAFSLFCCNKKYFVDEWSSAGNLRRIHLRCILDWKQIRGRYLRIRFFL